MGSIFGGLKIVFFRASCFGFIVKCVCLLLLPLVSLFQTLIAILLAIRVKLEVSEQNLYYLIQCALRATASNFPSLQLRGCCRFCCHDDRLNNSSYVSMMNANVIFPMPYLFSSKTCFHFYLFWFDWGNLTHFQRFQS